MTITAEDLYQLLPAVHRVRDADQGYPLRALVTVLAAEADLLAADVDGLYANWFIETCEDWVVPYLGDLLRVRRLHAAAAGSSERSYVANTLAYRRRKGTVSVIERLAYDVTGWRAKAVEEFHQLGATQNLNHLRRLCYRTPDLRSTADLELLGGPFETAMHAVEVRRIASTRGRYNIPDIAVMLWRLQAYPVMAATARPVTDPSDGRYTFNPLALDQPLYNPPRTETGIDHLAGEIDVPGRLRPRALHDELKASPLVLSYFAPGQEVFSVGRLAVPGATPDPVPVDELSICDLSNWQRPAAGTVAVDVARGRLCFPTGDVPAGVSVSYAFGFSADVGAGPYSRMASLQSWLSAPPTWVAAVTQDTATRQGSPNPSLVMATLGAAVAAWNVFSSANPGTFGVICIADSCSYQESSLDVILPAGSRLAIVAATAPGLLHGTSGAAFEPEGLMPHVRGDIRVTGAALPAGHAPGELILDGLLVQGGVAVLDGNLARLQLASATVTGSVTVATGGAAGQRNEQLQVEITDCLCGPLSIVGPIGGLSATNAVLDGGGGSALDAPASDLNLVATTVFGATAARTLSASNCLFTGPLQIQRLQAGCVRFSFVPDGSPVPRAFHCQPALALAKAPASEGGAIKARLTPIFTSQTLGDPGYAQLARSTAPEILTGADNGAEMGVFNLLQQPQREANLRAALDEYLRFGLEAGIFFLS